jgi:hypothetical protein
MTPQDQQLVAAMIKEAVSSHVHGVNVGKVWGKYLRNAPQTAIPDVTGSAGGTYNGTVQTLINDQTTAINSIISTLENLNLIE